MTDEDEIYGLVVVLVFVGVWVGCTMAFGAQGFLLGWMPAMILGLCWPFVVGLLVLGALLVAIVVMLT